MSKLADYWNPKTNKAQLLSAPPDKPCERCGAARWVWNGKAWICANCDLKRGGPR